MNDVAKDSAAPTKRPDRNRRTPIWILIQQAARIMTTVVFDLKTYGAYNVPKTGGVLLVSNHQSFLDPIILSSGLDRTLSYLAKAELFHNRYFGWLIRSLNAFPVEQGAGDVGAVREAISRLQEGHLLNVYPEGARTPDGEIQPMEKGIGLVIRRAKVPVVPVSITGSYEAWPKHKKYPRPHPIRIVIGPPMYDLWKLDREQILEKIDQTLRRMYEDAKAGRIPKNPPRPVGRKVYQLILRSDMNPGQSLVEQTVSGAGARFERTVWTWDAAAGQAQTALLFLDAEVYLMGVHALGVIQRLSGHHILPPLVAAFVSHKDSAARHVDFTCNAEYAAYIAGDVVGWLRKGHPAVNDIVIIGLSLSGLAAADIAVRYPQIFRAAICQSPSMWWKAGRFQTQIPNASRPDQEFWISVGDRETDAGVSHPPTDLFQGTSQLDACEQAAAALRAKGYSTTFRTYDGGHDPNCWREDLMLALPWAYRRS